MLGEGEAGAQNRSHDPIMRDELFLQPAIGKQQDDVGSQAERKDRVAELLEHEAEESRARHGDGKGPGRQVPCARPA